MSAGRVVNIKSGEPFDVYIGRAWDYHGTHYPASPWGNPFIVGRDGSRVEVIARYAEHVRNSPELMALLPALAGKALGCWCKQPDRDVPCHGDALLALVDEACHPRLELAQAQRVAGEIITALAPFCERIQVAGSIRRGKPTVKDVEIVAVPLVQRTTVDLFGETFDERDLLHEHVTRLREQGVVTDRPDKHGRGSFGPRTKRIRWKGVPLDLFSVLPPAQWGVIFAIRSGSADFAARFMTARRIGGVLLDDLIVRDGQLWRTTDGRPVPVEAKARAAFPKELLQLVPTPEERDFFQAIELPWVAPEERV